MCILCDKEIDYESIKELRICTKIKELSNLLINLENLDISQTYIKYIPKEFIKLKFLNCGACFELFNIPKELKNLEILYCNSTKITCIPKELINLRILDCYNTNISNIPKELINLEEISYNNTKKLINDRTRI